MRKINKYFKGVAEEAHRVRWPSSKELWKSVAIVLVITIICCLVLLLSDYIAAQMMKAFGANKPTTSGGSTTSTSPSASIANAIRFIGGLIK